MKIIVTHLSPDVDALTSVWLIKKFLKGWQDAEVKFVPAGKTLDGEIVDSNPDVMHVDTGMGMLDHHQVDDNTCAAKRTMEFVSQAQSSNLKSQISKGKNNKLPDEALVRLVDIVNDIDHFKEVYYPNPTADFYDFGLTSILDGWRLIYPDDHTKIIELGMIALDSIYKKFQDKVWAERIIKDEGTVFETRWGKGIGFETVNDDVVKLAQKQGYVVSARKDPKKGFIKIKALPASNVDLTSCYNVYRKLDSEATWYLHVSKKMLLNGSIKNPESKPTSLTLREIIDVLKTEDSK